MMVRKLLKGIAWLLLVLAIILGGLVAWNWDMVQRIFLGGVKVYETTPPKLPTEIKGPAILVFSKTNGFRHEEAIPAANALFAKMAKEEGWGYFQTENGATFSPEILNRFDAVIFNNVSGDVFTKEQRAAFKAFVEKGGGFVGIHGAGGDMKYDWNWYKDALIGAQFIGHPMEPQFQQAVVRVEGKAHPATAGLQDPWERVDEWYSFDKSVRGAGYNVLLTLDESSYSPKGLWSSDLKMGKDHPIAWWHCQGNGRALYSALGHQGSAYAEPAYAAVLRGATKWALKLEGKGCEAPEAKGTTTP
jgi:uncharacterized protein